MIENKRGISAPEPAFSNPEVNAATTGSMEPGGLGEPVRRSALVFSHPFSHDPKLKPIMDKMLAELAQKARCEYTPPK